MTYVPLLPFFPSPITHLERHVFLRLRVEGGIDDLATDEDPHVVLDLEGFDVDVWAFFLLFLDDLDELLAEQLGHVIHVATPFGSGDAEGGGKETELGRRRKWKEKTDK